MISNFFKSSPPLSPGPGDTARDRRSGRRRGACRWVLELGPCTPDEVSVRGGKAPLPRGDDPPLAPEHEGAAGLSPDKAGFPEDIPQAPAASAARLTGCERRTTQASTHGGLFSPLLPCRRLEVGHPPARAGADEHAVDPDCPRAHALFQAHIGRRPPRFFPFPGTAFPRAKARAIDRGGLGGGDAPADLRPDPGDIDGNLPVNSARARWPPACSTELNYFQSPRPWGRTSVLLCRTASFRRERSGRIPSRAPPSDCTGSACLRLRASDDGAGELHGVSGPRRAVPSLAITYRIMSIA